MYYVDPQKRNVNLLLYLIAYIFEFFIKQSSLTQNVMLEHGDLCKYL